MIQNETNSAMAEFVSFYAFFQNNDKVVIEMNL